MIFVVGTIVDPQSSTTTAAIVSRGTLVLQVPSRDGIVFCADKRRVFEGSWRYEDDEDKLFQLGSRSGFMLIGVRNIRHPQSLALLYDPTTVAQEYLTAETVDNIGEYLDGLAEKLVDSYKEYRASGGFSYWPKPNLYSLPSILTFKQPPDPLYALVFFYADGTKLRISKISVSLNATNDSLRTSRVVDIASESAHSEGAGAIVVSEILRGTDPRFDDVRRDPLVRRVRAGDRPVSFSTDEATTFAKLMIQSAHERLPLYMNPLHVQVNPVGPTCDCLLIGVDHAIRWLAIDAPARP